MLFFFRFSFSLQPFHKKHHGSCIGECTSSYQGDGGTSNIGGERGGRRLGDCERSALPESSIADEEASRVSEGSITSLVEAMEQRTTPRLSIAGHGASKTASREFLRPRKDAPTGYGNTAGNK